VQEQRLVAAPDLDGEFHTQGGGYALRDVTELRFHLRVAVCVTHLVSSMM
jgi:hypothetical protein